jgi:hypothetical protein
MSAPTYDPNETSIRNSLATLDIAPEQEGVREPTPQDFANMAIAPTGRQANLDFLRQPYNESWPDAIKDEWEKYHMLGISTTPAQAAEDMSQSMKAERQAAAAANDPMRKMQQEELQLKLTDFQKKPEEEKKRSLDNIYIMRDALNQLRNHKGRPAAIGYKVGRPEYMFGFANEAQAGTAAAGFEGLLKQIEGGVFRVVFPELKGAGPVTDVEGQKAQQSVSRLSTKLPMEDFTQAENDIENFLDRLESRMTGRPVEEIVQSRSPMPAADPSRTPSPTGSPAPSASPAPTPVMTPARQAAMTDPIKAAIASLGEETVIGGNRAQRVVHPDGRVTYKVIGPVNQQ